MLKRLSRGNILWKTACVFLPGSSIANGSWKATAGALKGGSSEFEMVWETADTGCTRQKAVPFALGRGRVVGAAWQEARPNTTAQPPHNEHVQRAV